MVVPRTVKSEPKKAFPTLQKVPKFENAAPLLKVPVLERVVELRVDTVIVGFPLSPEALDAVVAVPAEVA